MDFIPLLILWFYSIPGKTLIAWNQTPKWGKKDEYPANRGFSLAWHLVLTKSFAWLVGRINKPTTRQTSHANDFVNAKSHIDGRFRLYDFCLRLSCASGIRRLPTIPTRTVFTYDINNVSYECCGSNIYTTRSVVKSWRMLVAHDSRKQKSYRLNRLLERNLCSPGKWWITGRARRKRRTERVTPPQSLVPSPSLNSTV